MRSLDCNRYHFGSLAIKWPVVLWKIYKIGHFKFVHLYFCPLKKKCFSLYHSYTRTLLTKMFLDLIETGTKLEFLYSWYWLNYIQN